MSNPIVYCVQKAFKVDEQTQEVVPRFDLSAAARFGELRYLLGPSAGPRNVGDPVHLDEVKRKLADYRAETDYLLLMGNPVLIGVVTAIAAHTSPTGRVQFLQWSRRDGRYAPIVVEGLWLPPQEEE